MIKRNLTVKLIVRFSLRSNCRLLHQDHRRGAGLYSTGEHRQVETGVVGHLLDVDKTVLVDVEAFDGLLLVVGAGGVELVESFEFESAVGTDDTHEVETVFRDRDCLAGNSSGCPVAAVFLGDILGTFAGEINLGDLHGDRVRGGGSVFEDDESVQHGGRVADSIACENAVDEERRALLEAGRKGSGAQDDSIVSRTRGIGGHGDRAVIEFGTGADRNGREKALSTIFRAVEFTEEALGIHVRGVDRYELLAVGGQDSFDVRIHETEEFFGGHGGEVAGGAGKGLETLAAETGTDLAEIGVDDSLDSLVGELLAVRGGNFRIPVERRDAFDCAGFDHHAEIADSEGHFAFDDGNLVVGDVGLETFVSLAGVTYDETIGFPVALADKLVLEILLRTDGEIGCGFSSTDSDEFREGVSCNSIAHDMFSFGLYRP